MKLLVFMAVAAALGAQQPPPAARPNANPPETHGDDIRGYNDTPQLPGQKWKVHDMDRPRPPKVTPGPYVNEAPPSDAIVLFDGKDLSQWVHAGPRRRGAGTQVEGGERLHRDRARAPGGL